MKSQAILLLTFWTFPSRPPDAQFDHMRPFCTHTLLLWSNYHVVQSCVSSSDKYFKNLIRFQSQLGYWYACRHYLAQFLNN